MPNFSAAVLRSRQAGRHDRLPVGRMRGRTVRRLSLVPPRGDPVRGHLSVVAVGLTAARPAARGRREKRRGIRPRALSFDLPPCAQAPLGQSEGRAHARDVRAQPRLVHGDPSRPQGPHEHVFRTRGPRTVLRPPHRRIRLQYAVGVQGAGRPRKGHRPPCICR